MGSAAEKSFYGRIICATNCDLKQMVELKSFRKDLYYRLLVSELEIHPLRRRADEIAHLAHELSTKFAREFGVSRVEISPGLQQFFTSYNWPGNIRELKNLIEFFHLSELAVARVEDLPNWIDRSDTIQKSDLNELELDYHMALEAFEQKYFTRVLNHFAGAVNRTAREIGISKSTLIAKSRKYGINTWLIKANSMENYLRMA